MEWSEEQNVITPERRREVGCAICARKDWLEYRHRVYLWREPEKASALDDLNPDMVLESPSVQEELGHAAPQSIDLPSSRDDWYLMTNNEGRYCLGDAASVNKLLATSRYAKLMPSIPEEDLYASSVQHPRHPEMTWLLHTKRVPCLTAEKPLDPRCAGVGDIDATVWCCKTCINNLCRYTPAEIAMPPPALANLLWLGRERVLCQTASLGTRMLSCLGRPVWRKLILGRGDKDEQEKGIGGNCILLAQARPEELATSLPPTTAQLQQTFVVLFAHSIAEVGKAQMLVVNRHDYAALVRTRSQVCPVYADIPLDEERTRQLPENGVPEQFLACAQHLAETEKVCIASVGPASRPVDVACDSHGAAKPNAEEGDDVEDWEDLDDGSLEATKLTDAEQERQTFDTNTAEDVIAVDHSNELGLHETCAAFQTKLTALQEAAARVIAAQHRQAEETESSVGTPAEVSSVVAAGATAAAKEQCRTLVLETQELAKNLTKPELKRMADSFAEHADACVSTSGSPLSMFAPDTWSKCFVSSSTAMRCPT